MDKKFVKIDTYGEEDSFDLNPFSNKEMNKSEKGNIEEPKPKEKKGSGPKPHKEKEKDVKPLGGGGQMRRLLFMISASDYEVLSYIAYRRHVSIGSLVREAVSGYVVSAKESLTKTEKEVLGL